MTTEVSNTRRYLLRALYTVKLVLLGVGAWPTIISHSGAWDPVRVAAFDWAGR